MAPWSNISHSVTLSWHWPNQSLPYVTNVERQARKQQVSILYVIGLTQPENKPPISGMRDPVLHNEGLRIVGGGALKNDSGVCIEAWLRCVHWSMILVCVLKHDSCFSLCTEAWFLCEHWTMILVCALNHDSSVCTEAWLWCVDWSMTLMGHVIR